MHSTMNSSKYFAFDIFRSKSIEISLSATFRTEQESNNRRCYKKTNSSNAREVLLDNSIAAIERS